MGSSSGREGAPVETEIVFCERCGVSIPEGDVARARQASGGRDLCPNCVGTGGTAPGDLQLYFCENCRVSIAVPDVLTGTAKPEGAGYHCAVCSRSTPAERMARRTAVDREMAGIEAPDAAPGTRAGAAPLYFCDSCNASIPAALVATGRALVHSGRTFCERCRPRVESVKTRSHPGVGAGPVIAAALLATAVTAAAFVVSDRWSKARDDEKAAVAADDGLAKVQRDLRQTRETSDTTRGMAEATDRALRETERKLDALRTEVQAVRSLAEKAAAPSAAPAASAEKVSLLEDRVADLDDQVKILREDLAALSLRREGPGGGGMGGGSPPGAPPQEAPPEPPVPLDGGAALAPHVLSPEVQRCIALLKDKDAGVRFSAAIELGKLGDRGAWKALAEALRKDDDYFVRRACARSLGELKAYDAFPDLVDALVDGEEYVALQASRVIKEMAGQDFGFKQNQAKGDRKRVADRAKKWWEENKDRLAPGARE